jgi:hypothetical protein
LKLCCDWRRHKEPVELSRILPTRCFELNIYFYTCSRLFSEGILLLYLLSIIIRLPKLTPNNDSFHVFLNYFYTNNFLLFVNLRTSADSNVSYLNSGSTLLKFRLSWLGHLAAVLYSLRRNRNKNVCFTVVRQLTASRAVHVKTNVKLITNINLRRETTPKINCRNLNLLLH